MTPNGAAAGEGTVRYAGEARLGRPGPFGYTVRVVPCHPLLASTAERGLVTYPEAPEGMTNGLLRCTTIPRMGEFVRVERDSGIATIRLDRPKMNSLNAQVQDEIAAAALEVDADPGVRAVVLYGGEKVFAAGADIKEMAEASFAQVAVDSRRLQAAFTAVARIGKPVVAAVTGYALGGGLELALCADFRVAGEAARLGQPEILLGIIPGAGGTQRLPRLIGPARAKDIVFTGRFVGAAAALQIGLVDKVVPDDQVYRVARDLVAQYANGPAVALRAAKQAIDAGLEVDLDTGLELERLNFAALFATEDQRTGMRSCIEDGPGKATFAGR